MPANMQREKPLTVGDDDAVRELFDKVRSGHLPTSARMRELILKAGTRAIAMHDEDTSNMTPAERKAFTHGLLTGYSVATCLLQQQEEDAATH
ncbi:MAG: hypothetical protein PVJ49_05220 [Acidobacteriota bacterium]|jgi:hypothetical protein